jgi:hypothetical protein
MSASATGPARTYNQDHRPRRYAKGRRRVSVYVAWSYPGEANRDPRELDDRFSTMTEVRRVTWPDYEGPAWGPMGFQQSIAGSLELFFKAWTRFQEVVEEVSGYAVPMFQRVDQAGYSLPLDERVLDDTDTLLVFGLDHVVTEQRASDGEIEAVRAFLRREGTCLLLGPHHDVGESPDVRGKAEEQAHHGDPLVPPHQCFGGYTRSLADGLGLPLLNRWGLRPAVEPGTGRIAPLTIARDLDTRGWLEHVRTFNFHLHLPHYEVTRQDAQPLRVLATQPIDLSRPHPFTRAGHREFNTLLWRAPGGDFAGDVLVADSTIFSTLFGVDESLESFWRNLARAA